MGTLYYGDNLAIMREYIQDESVDLIYLDPPFNSNRNYNVLFKNESGKESKAQITAFEDTWHWDESAVATYRDIIQDAPAEVSGMTSALHGFIGESQMMAYLVAMTVRLVELHRVLKPTGSLYLHCDPTASHYLKIVLDTIFGSVNFRNEIVWHYNTGGVGKSSYAQKHDILLYYAKCNDQCVFNTPREASRTGYPLIDSDGRRYSRKVDTKSQKEYRYYEDEGGRIMHDVWDMNSLQSHAKERLGYPTQKPISLLERIISSSSNIDNVVLDPFCGCGTAIAAAQKLGRNWIGIDITCLAINLQKYRLRDGFGLEAGKDYQVIGEPADLESARQLALEDRYQFQYWALGLVAAKPIGGGKGKKGKDRGIDGIISFLDAGNESKNILVQVKSGHVKSGDIRDLNGTIKREKAAMGVFITLDPPTKDMLHEARAAGVYTSIAWQKDYPAIQILTIEQLMNGAEVKMPPKPPQFPQAERVKIPAGKQLELV